jgi:hypothetical protein
MGEPPMTKKTASKAECVRKARELYQINPKRVVSIFGWKLKLPFRSREIILIDYLGQPYLGTLVFQGLKYIESNIGISETIMRDGFIEIAMKEVNALRREMVDRDPVYFNSEDCRKAIYLISKRVYTLARSMYKAKTDY